MTGFGELHDDLRAVARDVLGKHTPQEAGGDAGAPVDGTRMADLGWLGLEVPDVLGGAGATFAEVGVVLEELGRAAAPCRYFGTVLGIGALLQAPASADRDALLRKIATGERQLAVALDGDAGVGAVGFRVDAASRLHGEATFVVDAVDADRILVPAIDANDRTVLVMVHAGSPGLVVTEQSVLDATHQLGTVNADGAELVGRQILELEGTADVVFGALVDRAALAVTYDCLGIAAAMLDATVAYAGVREQFGRPIGSFQAVKHACADMLVSISVARELVGEATRQLVDEPATAGPAISMAKSYVSTAAVEVVGKAMQLHGGIGYTWESGIHVYLKRATLSRSLFGSALDHRRRLAARFS